MEEEHGLIMATLLILVNLLQTYVTLADNGYTSHFSYPPPDICNIG
jgi:hypothetical protein